MKIPNYKLVHKIVVVCIFLGLTLSNCTQLPKDNKVKSNFNRASLIHNLNDQLTESILHDGFSPPVASRIYAYSNIAAYEAVIGGSSEYQSLSGQLNDFKPNFPASSSEKYDYELAMVKAFCTVAKGLIYRDYIMDSVQNELISEISSGKDEMVINASLRYGETIAKEIKLWISNDNYQETRSMPRFSVSKEPGKWVPTPPNYGEAIEPHWSKIRPFAMSSASQLSDFPATPFNSAEGSEFYNLALEVYEVVNSLSDKELEIARFWDCNPMVSVNHGHLMGVKRQLTPGGHWIGITRIATQSAKFNLIKACEAYTLVSIALADAFISSWDQKFKSNLIRPETYINEYIDRDWKPILETPLFPEHTSGHSVISRAAATVLTELLGDSYAFIDSTEVPFGLPPRPFKSFYDASNEAAISRIYGGIHYEPARKLGIEQGALVGSWVMENVKTTNN